ncbi:hypothetical protein EZS27_015354 [termite gut metagenome]|uniref:DUF4296 domain-containing protein n=2 Tax=termite gut metagenome TaxID=433724 RepID=A0A5J4RR82_9ZZZZ
MRKLRNKYGWLWCALILMIPVIDGCKVKRPKEVLSESQMEKLLYDYHIAKAIGEDLPYNENYKKQLYINYVFQKHGTTEEVFDSSMVWYTRHTDVLVKVYGKVNKLLKNQQQDVDRLMALHDKRPKKSASGDSIDVWAEQHVYVLTGYLLNNKITFSLPSDENFKKQDSLSWEVRYRFFHTEPDSTVMAVMAIQIVYNNDSVVSAIKKVVASGKESIGLKSDSLEIKEIRGFIYSPKRDTLEKGLLLLDSIVLMRYHRANDTIPGIETEKGKLDKEKLKEEEKPVTSSQPIQPEKEKPEEQNQRRIERPRPSATKTDSKKEEK